MEENKKSVEKPELVTDTRHTKEQSLKTVAEAVESLKRVGACWFNIPPEESETKAQAILLYVILFTFSSGGSVAQSVSALAQRSIKSEVSFSSWVA